jgi:hypothetical protein
MLKTTPLLLLVLLLVFACKKDNANFNARVTFLNASPDAPGFDIMMSGEQLSPTLAYGLPDEYVSVPALTDSIKWRLKGRSRYDTAFIGDIPNGTDFTMLFFDSASNYKTYFFKDRWQQPPSTDKAYLRFFPLVVGGDSLAVTAFINDTTIRNMSGRRVFADFTTVSTGNSFTPFDTLNTKFWLYNKKSALDSISNLRLQAGKSYTIYLLGVLGETTAARKPRILVYEHK